MNVWVCLLSYECVGVCCPMNVWVCLLSYECVGVVEPTVHLIIQSNVLPTTGFVRHKLYA